jgi:hypothetical protein
MKKITNFLKLILILGVSIKLNGQSKILVLDEETKDPIPFATIIYKDKLGTFTNDKGTFLLDHSFDKLVIKSIGYKELNLDVKEIKDTLWMSPAPINLEPIVVTQFPKKISYSKVNMKSNNDFPKSYLSIVGNEISTLIIGNENAKKSYLTYIKIPTNSSILKVRTKDNTKAKEVDEPFCSVFQIQFYENENGKPGQLLDYEPTIIKITQKDDKYFQIDLSEKKIFIPKDGVFFGLLAIGRADENGNLLLENPYEEKFTQNGLIRIGLSIRPLIPITEELKSSKTFMRYKFKTDGDETWSVFDRYSFSNSTTKIHNSLNLGIGYELKNYD